MAVQQTSAAAASAHIGDSTGCLSHSVGSWILDSSASDHVVGNPSLISNLLPPKIPYNITLANGSKAQVTGIGQALPLPSLSLNYVLFVPDSPFNLISISKLTHSLNCSITFWSDSFFIQDRSTGKMIGTGFESHGLYYLNPHLSTVCGVSASPDIIHCRLGHPSLDKLKVLVPQLSHLKTLDCESCQLDVTFFEDMPFFARPATSESNLQEIKFEPNVMCEPIDKKVTFRASQLVMVEWLIPCNWRLWQLEDGDIVCFQKAPSVDNEEQVRYPDVPSYLEYVHNRQVVQFRSLDRPKEDDFSLEMSRLYTYDDVVERVAQQLDLDDPSKIRLTPHNCYSQQPKPQPIKYRGVDHLSDMLVHYNQTSDILYYEVLDIPLPELQGLKTLKVAFHSAIKDEVVSHTIRLPKQSSVGDVLDDLKKKVELSHPDAELRLLEVFYHKIYKVFPSNEKIENINDQYWTLRAEEIPEEEKNIGPQDRLIHVYHFTKDTAQNQMQIQNFGDPFFLVIHEGEALSEIKIRIQKKLQVPDEEFSKWKFAFLSLGRPEYLQDSDIRRDVYGAWEQYLGLEHTDNAPKRSYAANQNRHTFEKPVKIYN
ncbi:hypothetical protein TSUD_399800 [Trifolium subterraneum]|uniref:ubiquitinyl hydrolase 1 n=1 Tax=Trifolium subterraneum TaxID=3900 RepID=A0A2Z6NI21_TRISU|nr:hypothetical protein TSUD_399800 [Trifolium subterraneum]